MWRSSDSKVFVIKYTVSSLVTWQDVLKYVPNRQIHFITRFSLVLLFSKTVRLGYMIHARMTTTFECTLSQLKLDFLDQKYIKACAIQELKTCSICCPHLAPVRPACHLLCIARYQNTWFCVNISSKMKIGCKFFGPKGTKFKRNSLKL